MSKVGPKGRSFKSITRADLKRLNAIAAGDRAQFFATHPDWSALYEKRFLAAALCQGAALHFVEGRVGVHDFDVYSFYEEDPARRWYAKRNKHMDFGLPKFGQSPKHADLVGRRVDLLGRGIEYRAGEDPTDAIRRWLRTGRTKSARLLARKAVVLLDPAERLGEIVWLSQKRRGAATKNRRRATR